MHKYILEKFGNWQTPYMHSELCVSFTSEHPSHCVPTLKMAFRLNLFWVVCGPSTLEVAGDTGGAICESRSCDLVYCGSVQSPDCR